MFKTTIKLCLITSIFFLQLSLPSFSMEDDIEIQSITQYINKLNNKYTEYKIKIENLEQENNILKNELQKKNDSYKNEIKKLSKKYETKIRKVDNYLTEADELIKFIVQSPPTVHSYLSAVFNQAPDQELGELFTAATHKQFIGDIIIGGHIKFKAGSPISHIKLLKITGLLNSMKITQDDPTIQYGRVLILASPKKDVNEKKDAIIRTKARLEKEHQVVKKVKEEVEGQSYEEEEKEKDEIQFAIQQSPEKKSVKKIEPEISSSDEE